MGGSINEGTFSSNKIFGRAPSSASKLLPPAVPKPPNVPLVRSVAPSDEEVESRGEQEAVLSYAVGILARCWPLVEQLILCRCEGAAELASSAGRAAAAAMRADGRAFLGALEGLLRTVLSALRRAEVLQEGVETATSLMVRVKPPPEAPWRKRFGDARNCSNRQEGKQRGT